jgi:antitoxin component YwqK of YwqJK toxin-antitoxin module
MDAPAHRRPYEKCENMALPLRVNEDEFELDDDQVLYNGQPFTGTGFSYYPNSRLKREAPYKDGFEEGVCRVWYAGGQLKREWFAVHGTITGKATEWHESGEIKSVAEFEGGVELNYDEWTETGSIVTHREIDKASALFKYAQEMGRKRSQNEPL